MLQLMDKKISLLPLFFFLYLDPCCLLSKMHYAFFSIGSINAQSEAINREY